MDRPGAGLADGENPWRDAARLLGGKARRHMGLILLSALACAALAGAAKIVLPSNYKVSAQILIDPQESRTTGTNENASTPLEATAAINYVESQMGVIGSDRVLLRVIRDQGLAGAPSSAEAGARQNHEKQLGDERADGDRRARDFAENKALIALQKAVKVLRAERSFLINITVEDKDPEKAARIADAVVSAYGEVNRIDRAAAARMLSDEFLKRIEDMRRMLGESEARLQNYKTDHNLVGLHEKTVTERRTTEASAALTAAENREAMARARLKQLESAPVAMNGVAALGPDPESRQLQVLIEGRSAVRSEAEQLASTLGDRHPMLAAARERLRDFDRRIAESVEGLRHSARSQLAEAQSQTASLTKKLSDLANEMSRGHESDVALQQLEDEVEGKRKALSYLEAHQRDANGVSHAEASSFRIVSPARVPNTPGKGLGVALWSLCGGFIGAALALAGLAGLAVFEEGEAATTSHLSAHEIAFDALPAILPAPGRRRLPPVEAMQEVERRPAEAFAQKIDGLYRALKAARPGADGPFVVVVAATEPQAGASTLAANLVRAAAARGERTLLIDAHRAHPMLDLMIPASAPKTLIELAGRQRPLYRLEPFSQSLSLIPALAREEAVCRVIAGQSAYRRIAGVKGNFDFVVFDGPDAGNTDALSALVAAANALVLVAPNEARESDLAPLLERLGAAHASFVACFRSASRRQSRAA
jgi:uncharacterized protein involved in exopolysaccharide biosynthesis/Mrp family chromosome partitioning ATPase